MNSAERLEWAMSQHPGLSKAEVARAAGLKPVTFRSYFQGHASPPLDACMAIEAVLGVSGRWLFDGTGSRHTTDSDVGPAIPLAGVVSAGAEAVFIDQSDTQAAPEVIRFPLSREHIAFRVSGDSMSPRFMPGERLVFGAPRDPSGLINQEVMAQIKDGPLVVKVLRRGQEPGRWTLWSHNPAHPPIEDASIEWARPLEGWMK